MSAKNRYTRHITNSLYKYDKYNFVLYFDLYGKKNNLRNTPVSGNINTVSCVNRVFEDWLSKRPRGGMQLRKIRAENAAGPVSVLGSSDVVSACRHFVSLKNKSFRCFIRTMNNVRY